MAPTPFEKDRNRINNPSKVFFNTESVISSTSSYGTGFNSTHVVKNSSKNKYSKQGNQNKNYKRSPIKYNNKKNTNNTTSFYALEKNKQKLITRNQKFKLTTLQIKKIAKLKTFPIQKQAKKSLFALSKSNSFKFFNLNRFFTQNLENALAYLGYSTKFRSPLTNFFLIGTRSSVDLHSLINLKYQLNSVFDIVKKVVFNFGTFWFLSPFNNSLTYKSIFSNFGLNVSTNSLMIFQRLLGRGIVIWTRRWVPGSFTNKSALKPILKYNTYPSLVFNPSNTVALQTYSDVRNINVLQITVVDSNCLSINAYPYKISMNEKTAKTNIFLAKMIMKNILIKKLKTKVNFFKKK